MKYRSGVKPRSGRIFLTLQSGGRLHCLALSPAFFFGTVTLVGVLLAAGLTQTALSLVRANTAPAFLAEAEMPGASMRISMLQSEVERLSSRDVVTTDLVERRLRELAARQAELEAQALTLESLGAAPHFRKPNAAAGDESPEQSPVRLKKLEGAMNDVGQRHVAILAALADQKAAETRAMEAAFKAAGLNPGALSPPPQAGVGGPFVPLKERFRDSGFAVQIRESEPALTRHAQLTALLSSIPFRAPLVGGGEVSSRFGPRIDPFSRRSAWHAGVDLRNEYGADVLATASGTIVSAGWNGPYGLMIEIDHGAGLSTRYGHLSKTMAREGQRVEAGGIIGRSGSTGRSTGAHLHYEVRDKGEAVDPARFLRAGEMIAHLLDSRSRSRDLAQLVSK